MDAHLEHVATLAARRGRDQSRRSPNRPPNAIDAAPFVTHHFGLDEVELAYDIFSDAADTGALKVVLARARG